MPPFLNVPVSQAERIADALGKDLVVIVTHDNQHDRLGITTFGRLPEEKERAAALGDKLLEFLEIDLSRSETHEDFHEDDDEPVQFRPGAKARITLFLESDSKPFVIDEALSSAFLYLDFVTEIDTSGVAGHHVVVEADTPGDLVRLLPAMKTSLRDVIRKQRHPVESGGEPCPKQP